MANMPDLLLSFAGAITAATIICGAMWRFVKPWLKEQLITPMNDVQRAVTENGHKDAANPTLRDDIANLQDRVDRSHKRLEAKIDSEHEDLREHVRDSRREHEEMQTDIRLLKKAIKE